MFRAAVVLAMCLLVSGCSLLFESEETVRGASDGDVIDAGLEGDGDDLRGVELGPIETLSVGSADSRRPSVAWDEQNYRVVWQQDLANGSEVRSSTAGAGSPVTVATTTLVGGEVACAWTGSALLIGWLDGVANSALLRSGLFDPTQTLLGNETDLSSGIAGYAQGLVIAPAGPQTGIAWQQVAGLESKIVFARLGGDGALVSAPTGGVSQALPGICRLGIRFGLAW